MSQLLRVVTFIRRVVAAPDGSDGNALLGPCDEAALRAALAIPGAAVTAISAGAAEREDEALRHALTRGAARALRVSDATLEGIDYHGVARVLAAAARIAGFDLLLAGERSADGAEGAVGPAVAELLGIGHVTAALDVRVVDGLMVVDRRDAGGRRTLRFPPPLLVTVTRSPAPWPKPRDETAAIEALGLQALGIQALELRHRVGCAGRIAAARAGGATLVARPEELIARLVDERLLGS